MKHGVAFRKFSRTSSHRMLMLRNLVTSLIEHEQIKTTVAKAKDTARLAEKIITMGKNGDLPNYQRANGFLLNPQLTPKVFKELAERYANRPGGYTRIHKFGNRPGDNAPHAIVELVDNPRDVKFEMAARAVGWDILSKRVVDEGPTKLVQQGVDGVEDIIQHERELSFKDRGQLRPLTRWNLQKVLRFRPPEAISELKKKAESHIDDLLAKPLTLKTLKEGEAEKVVVRRRKIQLKAGQKLPGIVQSSLRLAQGALGEVPGKHRWFERRKLGVDTSDPWQRL